MGTQWEHNLLKTFKTTKTQSFKTKSLKTTKIKNNNSEIFLFFNTNVSNSSKHKVPLTF